LLSIRKQCELLSVSRSSYYYQPVSDDDSDQKLFEKILEVYVKHPFYGYRKIALELGLGSKLIRRVMHKNRLKAIFPKRNLSKAAKENVRYPYLLRKKLIAFPNQVWASDITYLKVNGCYVYLVAIIDVYSRKVLSWRISNSMDVSFCIDCLLEAMRRFGIPAIFNSDQGSQFTSAEFTSVLLKAGVRISMDGTGRALDNIFMERVWRSLKYEEIYLNSYQNLNELKMAVGRYFRFYNSERFHQGLDYDTPDGKYEAVFKRRKMRA
jgi:putative transposase